MFVETLSAAIQNNLDTIARMPLVARFYLAGGTAAALHLGHLKSLTYFADAEEDEMPHLLEQTSWQAVKRFFESEAKSFYLGGQAT